MDKRGHGAHRLPRLLRQDDGRDVRISREHHRVHRRPPNPLQDLGGTHTHLAAAFKILEEHNLKVNLEKCEFGQDSVNYLGHVISEKGATPGHDKTEAIRRAQPPATVRSVKSFIGLCNFFRAYIRDFSAVAAPLLNLTRGNSKWKGGELPPAAMAAFKDLQKQLVQQPCLAFPTSDGEFQLYTDASGGVNGSEGALGAALTQVQGGEKRMIAYASRRLKKHEKNYSAYLLEKAAIVYAVEHFGHLLKGRSFAVFTDHRPITALSNTHKKTFNRLEQLLLEYSFDIRYIPGRDNTVADFLSREGWIQPDTHDGMGISALDSSTLRIATAQHKDPLCIKMRQALAANQKKDMCRRMQLQDVSDTHGVLRVALKARKGAPPGKATRVLAPKVLRPFLIKQGHDAAIAGHGGIFKTKERIAAEFWWPRMVEDVAEHIRACDACNAARQHTRQHDSGITPLPQPARPNDRVHIDLFGPLRNEDDQQRFIMVITDAFSKIVRLQSIPDKTATTVAEAVMQGWITIYGVPKTIVSDQGREFCNKLLKGIWELLQVEHKTTSPVSPEGECPGRGVQQDDGSVPHHDDRLLRQDDQGMGVDAWTAHAGP